MRRVRTNTPLAALTTLNDPAFFEAAQALAGESSAKAVRRINAPCRAMASGLRRADAQTGRAGPNADLAQQEKKYFSAHRTKDSGSRRSRTRQRRGRCLRTCC